MSQIFSKLLALGEASVGPTAVAATVPWAAGMVRDVAGKLGTDRLDYAVQAQKGDMLETLRQQMEGERLESLMATNTQRLAQYAPEVYTQVMAGRRLPRGAVVIGGTPNLDAMDQLALAMSKGRFTQKPASAQDRLMQLL